MATNHTDNFSVYNLHAPRAGGWIYLEDIEEEEEDSLAMNS